MCSPRSGPDTILCKWSVEQDQPEEVWRLYLLFVGLTPRTQPPCTPFASPPVEWSAWGTFGHLKALRSAIDEQPVLAMDRWLMQGQRITIPTPLQVKVVVDLPHPPPECLVRHTVQLQKRIWGGLGGLDFLQCFSC
uniref:Uncharacterized protein n=1 Tax=Eutreptiella gymnastica TaxID=73025 RepID=A0A7S1IQB6_9EUGL|mmetsp:Transcript_35497/g.63445  ORF Transcript_35497/g.63445 Transcript_35497/m.63445 type:complete len:136 (+) Transcript_35497:137-544(+)